MTCFYCAGSGLDEQGSCAQCQYSDDAGGGCGRLICTDACAREDDWFHGSECRCGCGKVICKAHAEPHRLQRHKKSDPIQCFPALVTSYAKKATQIATEVFLHRAGTAYMDPRRKKSWMLSEFLNVITPGTRILKQTVARLGDESYHVQTWHDRAGGEFIHLAPAFFSEAVIDNMFALGLRVVARASLLDTTGESDFWAPSRLSWHQQSTLPLLAAWSAEKYGGPDPSVFRAWLPDDAPESVIRSVERHMAYAASKQPPSTPEQIALWLAEVKVDELVSV